MISINELFLLKSCSLIQFCTEYLQSKKQLILTITIEIPKKAFYPCYPFLKSEYSQSHTQKNLSTKLDNLSIKI